MATPGTSMCSTSTKKRSPTMFSTEEITRKISGVTLSPRARRNEAKKLYRDMNTMPAT